MITAIRLNYQSNLNHTHCAMCGRMLRQDADTYATQRGADGWLNAFCIGHAPVKVELCSEGERP